MSGERSRITILAGHALLILTLTLWPFRLDLACVLCVNKADWADAALDLSEPGLLRTAKPPAGLRARLVSAEGLTVETVVTPATLDQGGPARIVTYSQAPVLRNFTLGQQGGDIVFRISTTEAARDGLEFEEIIARNALEMGRRQHLAVTYDRKELRIYVDGRLRGRAALPGRHLSNWDESYTLLIGNEVGGQRPWLGLIEFVSIHDQALPAATLAQRAAAERPALDGAVAYDFSDGRDGALDDRGTAGLDARLELPRIFLNVASRELFSPTPRAITDVISNLLLFYSVGLIAGYALACRGRGAAFGATVLILVTAESLQFFVVDRTSSLIDLVAGLAGGAMGTAHFPFLQRRHAVPGASGPETGRRHPRR